MTVLTKARIILRLSSAVISGLLEQCFRIISKSFSLCAHGWTCQIRTTVFQNYWKSVFFLILHPLCYALNDGEACSTGHIIYPQAVSFADIQGYPSTCETEYTVQRLFPEFSKENAQSQINGLLIDNGAFGMLEREDYQYVSMVLLLISRNTNKAPWSGEGASLIKLKTWDSKVVIRLYCESIGLRKYKNKM